LCLSRYEGTGRSLSLKLISQLRSQTSTKAAAAAEKAAAAPSGEARTNTGSRALREVSLEEPIRYGDEDEVEKWLMNLLCLNAADYVPRVPPVLPHPDDCELFYVERDTLFSGHRVTEIALQRMMSLYVASHYKNTPNDLLLLSDAPAHHLFVLTAPVPDKSKARSWLCFFPCFAGFCVFPMISILISCRDNSLMTIWAEENRYRLCCHHVPHMERGKNVTCARCRDK
jgi:tRNA(Met) C34 N-acetyltransferase TmcA